MINDHWVSGSRIRDVAEMRGQSGRDSKREPLSEPRRRTHTRMCLTSRVSFSSNRSACFDRPVGAITTTHATACLVHGAPISGQGARTCSSPHGF